MGIVPAINGQTLHLPVGAVIAPPIRTFVPVDAEPPQIFQQGPLIDLGGALLICIFQT